MPRDSAQYEPVWRDWQTGCREAAERGLPALVSLDPDWSTAGQRLDLIAGRDPGLQRALDLSCIPVRVDPLERPDLETRFVDFCKNFGGLAATPCLVLVTSVGKMLLPFTSLAYEGDGEGVPSLASVIEAARDISLSTLEADEAGHDDGRLEHCRLDPVCLSKLVDRARSDIAQRDDLRRQIDVLLAGGVHDQIGHGFHAAARDDAMIVPFFEKPLPLNAGMAAILAETATILESDDLMQIANETAAFVVDHLIADPDAQVVAADAHYYTWTPKEFASVIPREVSKSASMHFHMTLAEIPHVLYAARTPEKIAEYGANSPRHIAGEIREAKEALAVARSHRPAPKIISKEATNWTAQSIRWLAAARNVGCDTVDHAFLVDLFEKRILPRMQSTGEVWHDDQGGSHFAEDAEAARVAAQMLGR